MGKSTIRKKDNTNTSNLGLWAIIAGLLIACMPVVDYFCSWYITIIPVFVVVAFVKENNDVSYIFRYIVFSLFYCILSFWFVYRNDSFIIKLVNDFVLWIPIIYAHYISVNMDKERKKNILQIFSVLLLITTITTIIGLKIYPMASRELASGTAIYDTDKYHMINIGGYDFVYGLVAFVPVQMWLIKNTVFWTRVFNIFTMVMFFFVIVESSYTIALLLFLVLIVFCIFRFSKKSILLYASIVLLLLFMFRTIIIDLLEMIRTTIAHEYVSDRILQIIQLLSGVKVHTQTSTSRVHMFQNTFQAFLDKPFFGNNIYEFKSNTVCHHSTILDTLASGGLFYFALYIHLIRSSIKISRTAIHKHSSTLFQIIIAFFMVAVLNPVSTQLIYFVLLVGGGCVNSLENEADDITNPIKE